VRWPHSRHQAHPLTRQLLRSLPLALGLSIFMSCLLAPPALAEDVGVVKVVNISAVDGWQETQLELVAGQQFSINYLSGNWTVDKGSLAMVGPEGYSTENDSAIYQGCKYDSNSPYGVLYGQVSAVNGTAFPVRRGGLFTAQNDGELYLRINDTDQCLADNAGEISVSIITGTSNQSETARFFEWLSACIDGQLGQSCQDDAYGIARISDRPDNAAGCAQQGAQIARGEGSLFESFDAAYTCLGTAAGAFKQFWEQHGGQ
jgi:hypothetical protein